LDGLRCHFVRRWASAQAALCSMGTQLPQKKGAATTQFLAHVYCGQAAGCMMTPLGTEVDLGRGQIVRVGPSYPRERGTAAPPLLSAHVYCGQTPVWMKTPLGTDV